MSIRKADDEWEARCVGKDCGRVEYGGVTESRKDFLHDLRAAGWVVRVDAKVKQLPTCPDCQEE
jgi:hypothetical protein